MLKILLPCVLLSCGLLKVDCGDYFTGPGLWHVINVMKCEEDGLMPVKLDVTKRKLNRTHDGFNAKISLDRVIDESYGLYADICKKVDGGCKKYQVLADDSLAKFLKKYAESNVKAFMESAKIDPPDFPIQPGEYETKGFIVNYEELPEDGPYGDFRVRATVLKDSLEKACLLLDVDFKKKDD